MEYVEEIGEIRIGESENMTQVKMPLKMHELQEIQKQDSYCRDIASKLQKKQYMNKSYVMEKGVIHRIWFEYDKTFKSILVLLRYGLCRRCQKYCGYAKGP